MRNKVTKEFVPAILPYIKFEGKFLISRWICRVVGNYWEILNIEFAFVIFVSFVP